MIFKILYQNLDSSILLYQVLQYIILNMNVKNHYIRKSSLFSNLKVFFYNLEHVASPTQNLHKRFLEAIGTTVQTEDKSDNLLDVNTQLEWLKEIGFTDVGCYWKWLEMALLIGVKP
jgi:hypothetical protein